MEPATIVRADQIQYGGAPTPTAIKPRSWFLRISFWLFIVLIAGSWLFIFTGDGARLSDLFSAETWEHSKRFLSRFAGIGVENPAYLDAGRWWDVARLAYRTLAMSVLAIGFATIGMLVTVILAARTFADGTLSMSRSRVGWIPFLIIRGAYIFSRAVPELIWAMLIVFVFSPGILPGAIALGIHNFGILGKLCAEVVEDIDLRPLRAVRTTGASAAQTLLYAALPQALPPFLTFILYRWEVIIRTTIVVGFVSAGGLGREFRLSMSFFDYTDVALLLFMYFVLVLLVDLISAGLRHLAR